MSADICVICAQPSKEGVRIFSALLCAGCEAELIEVRANDPRYDEFVLKLKRAWSLLKPP